MKDSYFWYKNCSRNCFILFDSRGVAQPGSATVLGTVGREFESRRPDHLFFIDIDPKLNCWLAKNEASPTRIDVNKKIFFFFENFC